MRLRGAREAAAQIKGVGGALGGLAAQQARATAGMMANFKRMLPSLTAMANAGQKMKSTGSAMTRNITVPVVGLGAASLYAAAQWESAFAGVRKTVDATAPQLQRLGEGFQAMSERIPVSANDLAEIGAEAGALGIQTKNILGFTRVVADLGEATDMTGLAAAEAFARFANITGMPQTQFSNLGSTVVDLGNKMAATESEIAAMGLRIAGAGNQVGLSESQIMSFAAGLASVGINAEAGGTAISQSFLKMNSAVLSGSKELKTWAAVSGVSVKQFKTMFKKDAATAMIQFMAGLQRVKNNGGDVSGVLSKVKLEGIRVQDMMMRGAGASKLMSRALGVGASAWKKNNALSDEARKRYKTFESRLQTMKNTIVNTGVAVGNQLLPPLSRFVKDVAPKIRSAAKWFAGLPGPVQKAAIGGVLFAAALGPIVWLLGSMITSVTSIVKGYQALRAVWVSQAALTARFNLALVRLRATQIASAAAAKIAAAGQWILNVAMTANPIGLVVVAIAALVAGFVLAYKKIGWFRKGVDAIWSWLKGAVVSVIDFVKSHWKLIVAVILGPVTLIAYGIYKYWDQIKRFTSNAFNAVKRFIMNAIRGAINFVRNHWRVIISILGGPIGLAVALISKHWGSIKAGAAAVVNFIRNGFNALVGFFGSIPGRLASAGASMFDFLKSSFKSAINYVINAWNGLSFSIPGFDPPGPGSFPGFTVTVPQITPLAAGGTVVGSGWTMVGENGPELLHQNAGARVVPLSRRQRGEVGLAPGTTDEKRGGDDRPIELHANLHVDGRKMASVVKTIGDDERDLR